LNADQLKQLENDLWSAADTLRANSGLKSSEYATPILGLIFLKFADNKYRHYEAEIRAEYEKYRNTRAEREIAEIAIEKCGFYLPDTARYDYLLNLPESEEIARAVKEAMEEIERNVSSLAGTLPKDEYFTVGKESKVLKRLLQNFSNIPADAEGDLFGQIYEFFLGKFALAEGAGGGEFFTPRSVVRLMVEIIEPHRGKVFDPACGSGGMFVQSARFIAERRKHGGTDVVDDLYVYGQEKTLETVKLAKMNLAVNGIRGEIKEGNSYSQDLFDSYSNFDYVLANPPFNVDNVDVETVVKDKRFTEYGLPRNKGKASGKAKSGEGHDKGRETVPNGNYLWISLFATSLKAGGRAALVMANSASDAQHTEADIRRRLIQANLIYGMLTIPSHMFYTVMLPATLWFFEKDKTDDRILFIDARNVYTQIDRAHREFTDEQVQNLAIISYLHRGERHRFLERIAACLAQSGERLTECRTEFPCVQQMLLDALPAQLADDLACEEETVAQTAQAVRDAADRIAQEWQDETRERQKLLDGIVTAELVPDAEGMSEAQIKEKNGEQTSLVAAVALSIRCVRSEADRLDRCLRDYDKAVTERAEANGKRRPQDRKLRDARAALEQYIAHLKLAAEPLRHATWLQERFPEAEYTDVVGLCKLATQAEVAEQDYSLNPGRYVGVVIEEDGKTAEEFRAELLALNSELEMLNAQATELALTLSHNVKQLVGIE
jgi:type I restriction enzyme M protein